ncbi:MAG TPA: hypothetical protein DEG17_02855 [Cyanobacteria bacterium UBA11149]|nr:hypothetical protein [Cyanobacteria bacterium UBA11367]HBE56676.1 hypothetical protein [Cyanobacteria bacterium UBA11366]HBK66376.1 hypothetical protein [Cyanobacteria bacterium UBA11166]HBR74142.1 hypothetical protein [Cyanobacteria bacterium UBA11159]HBS72162.1 hypothetical protein [Cyanobacteria bacterium UBA11153]HBW87845.1 hypothetical protein [Cyanobacteria bacterium UBA11149]HCA93675.1 hypothetical protein [Cyanobacteria bacterium UBA9226]
MLMINIQELKKIAQKYYYQDKLFTGVGFRVDGYKIEEALKFESGICLGQYTSKYFANEKEIIHVDMDCLEFPGDDIDYYPRYKNNNDIFSGVAYELGDEEKVCLEQHLFEDGIRVASVGWYLSGQMHYLTLMKEEDLSQSFGWYEDGSLGGIDMILEEKKERIIVTVGEQKQLKTVWIEENYFEWMPKYQDRFEFHYFETNNSFAEFSASPNFSLIAPGVDDIVFHSIASNNGFKNLYDIDISRTSLSQEAIMELVNVKTLKKLTIDDNRRNLLSIAQEFKHQRPDCLVTLNNSKITVP